MFEYAQFVQRNPLYAVKDWRRQSAVRKAILRKRERTPFCQYCNSTKDLQVHHDVPVWVTPQLAADPDNLTTLCRRCHLTIGHLNNYKMFYQMMIKRICKVSMAAVRAD